MKSFIMSVYNDIYRKHTINTVFSYKVYLRQFFPGLFVLFICFKPEFGYNYRLRENVHMTLQPSHIK